MGRPRSAMLGGLAVALALFGVDRLLGGQVSISGLYVAAPFVVSGFAGARRTAVVAAVAVGLGVISGALEGMATEADQLIRVGGVALGGGFAVWSAGRSERRDERLDRMTLVAEAAQVAILHPVPERVGRFSVAVRYVSAAREAVVGGDFYDVVETVRGVRVVVGDVRGKGLPAIRLAAIALGAFRETVYDRDLEQVAQAMDRSVSRHLGGEDFVTVLLLDLGPDGRLEVVNCGHPAPLLVGGSLTFVEGIATTPLGLGPKPVLERFTMDPSQRLLAYTDGLIEARDTESRFFPMDAVRKVASARGGVADVLDRLVDAVIAHAGGKLDDDLALVLIGESDYADHVEGAQELRLDAQQDALDLRADAADVTQPLRDQEATSR
jgi:phosphoserine phosphatase RsbU/P